MTNLGYESCGVKIDLPKNCACARTFGYDEPVACICDPRYDRLPTLPEMVMERVGGIPCSGHEDLAAGTWTFHREDKCPQ